MILKLSIHNFILIEKAEIPFAKGFNVLSGESGAGKSAIMHALRLICGERFDIDMLRRGCDKGFVEAVFTETDLTKPLLEGYEIDHAEELIIRREFTSAGKSRALVNDQVVNIQVLKQISAPLIDILGQHANQQLRSPDFYREIVDTYGDLQELSAKFSETFTHQAALQARLDNFIHTAPQRVRDIERYEHELEELSSVNLKENEEEELFAEYTLLTSTQERHEIASELYHALSGDRAAVSQICRLRSSLTQLLKLDPSLKHTHKGYDTAVTELQELSATLRDYCSKIDSDPNRLTFVNERLALITSVKKRYGASIADIQNYQRKVVQKLHELQNAECEIENLQKSLSTIASETDAIAAELTAKRQAVCKKLEQDITKEIRTLNMPSAQFFCTLEKKSRSRLGDDQIEFLLAANRGEDAIPVKESASGGELSRLMLVLHLLLAGKKKIPTLVFDEIDANIGGETATIVGAKLQTIGEKHQLLCITHFPQVAKAAHHHLRITKQEGAQRTWTEIDVLDASQRPLEWLRMAGTTKG